MFQLSAVGDVSGNFQGAPAEGAEFRCRLADFLSPAADHHHVSAGFRQSQGDGLANPTGTPNYQRIPTIQT